LQWKQFLGRIKECFINGLPQFGHPIFLKGRNWVIVKAINANAMINDIHLNLKNSDIVKKITNPAKIRRKFLIRLMISGTIFVLNSSEQSRGTMNLLFSLCICSPKTNQSWRWYLIRIKIKCFFNHYFSLLNPLPLLAILFNLS